MRGRGPMKAMGSQPPSGLAPLEAMVNWLKRTLHQSGVRDERGCSFHGLGASVPGLVFTVGLFHSLASGLARISPARSGNCKSSLLTTFLS